MPDDRPDPSPHAALGFGCASLFRAPDRRDRRAVLDAAYDLGIRHFDTAPMYGLGRSEPELGAFLRAHPAARVGTKLGIATTLLGRAAGRVQGPLRRALRRSSAAQAKAQDSGAGPGSGAVGRLLYADHDFSVEHAGRSLAASLRDLGRDRLDHLFLHEPAGVLGETQGADLADFLDARARAGVVGAWGPAGDLAGSDPATRAVLDRGTTAQYPYDLVGGFAGPDPAPGRATLTFGILASALPRVTGALAADPALRETCSTLLDADLADDRTVVALLVRDAVLRNPHGTVLLSTTRIDHLRDLCAAAESAMRNEIEVADRIRAHCASAQPAR